jgi:hypothetical protein
MIGQMQPARKGKPIPGGEKSLAQVFLDRRFELSAN